jgi:transcriptional regulator with XRE-family HTH domain
MLQEQYPNRLSFFRKLRHLSQKQMAALIGLKDRTMISKYERGQVLPSLPVESKMEIVFHADGPDIFPQEFKQWNNEVEHVKETKFKHKQI